MSPGRIEVAAKLYADATLQVFFIVTSALGCGHWLRGHRGDELPVRTTPGATIGALLVAAILVAAAYGWLLHRFTDAYAPFLDSAVLAFSVLGQFLLMGRRYESWYCWLLVDTIAVPLFASRGPTSRRFSTRDSGERRYALVHWRRFLRESA